MSERDLESDITLRINDIDNEKGSLSAERKELVKLRRVVRLYRKKFTSFDVRAVQADMRTKNPYVIGNRTERLRRLLEQPSGVSEMESL